MSAYRFEAQPGGHVSPEVRAAYEEFGFVVFDRFVPAEVCSQIRDRASLLMRSADPAESRTVFSTTAGDHTADRYFMESGDKIRFFWEADAFDDEGTLRESPERCLNKIGHALHDLDPVFEAFSYRPEMGAISRALGHKAPSIIQSMYILKPPRIGGEVTCHQDSTYIYTEPDTCLGFWFAVEDATVENGCMHFLPGEHKGPLRSRSQRDGPFSTALTVFDDTPWSLEAAVPVEAPAGSLVVFHGRAPHFSGPNRSEHSRHAYTLHVVDRSAHYPDTNWLQRSSSMPLRPL